VRASAWERCLDRRRAALARAAFAASLGCALVPMLVRPATAQVFDDESGVPIEETSIPVADAELLDTTTPALDALPTFDTMSSGGEDVAAPQVDAGLGSGVPPLPTPAPAVQTTGCTCRAADGGIIGRLDGAIGCGGWALALAICSARRRRRRR
jgi:hypothetical protein